MTLDPAILTRRRYPDGMATAAVSYGALEHNLKLVRRRLAEGVGVLAAVKANAYGHGSVPVARRLEQLGVSWFGVATAEEALELRGAGVGGRILVFSPVYASIRELVDYDVALTVTDEAALAAVLAAKPSKPARLHVKVDTGMGRLGLAWPGALELARKVAKAPGMVLEGVWTHFAASDDEDPSFTQRQHEAFQSLLAALRKDGIEPLLAHCANSAAIFAHPDTQHDLVRPGIALYGYHSSPFIAGLEPGLRPVLTLSAPVTFVKRVEAGSYVSYSRLWQAPRDTTIATVRIGYADGYPRLLTGKGTVLLHGQERPIAGRVCMDQVMVDAGELSVAVGDRVTLFGPGPLDAETLAARIGTISYELLTSLAPRVERVYS